MSGATGRIFRAFLSTLSLRRATLTPARISSRLLISIHALLAESDLRVVDGSKSSIISIHALLAESDGNNKYTQEGYQIFLSTLSLRRATTHPIGVLVRVVFLSTLSLRRATAQARNRPRRVKFLSTLSLRRATV